LKHLFAALCGIVVLSATTAAFAGPSCTIVADAESQKVIVQTGDCAVRTTPASTFKLAMAVMGYDTGILKDAHNPTWPFKPGYPDFLEAWKHPTDPTRWLAYSVVWYSQVLTRHLGPVRFARYARDFHYGNHDVSGNPGKHDGLTQAWLSSSLAISPVEQVAFLDALVHRTLLASPMAQEKTLAIMPTFPAADGWTVHGKTGQGFPRKPDGSLDHDHAIGWFVGYAENGPRRVVFARRIQDDAPQPVFTSLRARDGLIADLPEVVGR
jgi:beta-lactamase class D